MAWEPCIAVGLMARGVMPLTELFEEVEDAFDCTDTIWLNAGWLVTPAKALNNQYYSAWADDMDYSAKECSKSVGCW